MRPRRKINTKSTRINAFESPRSVTQSGQRSSDVAQRVFCYFFLFLGTPLIGHVAMFGILCDSYLDTPFLLLPVMSTTTFSLAVASVSTLHIMSMFDVLAGAFCFHGGNNQNDRVSISALKLALLASPSRVLVGPFTIYWSSAWLVAVVFVALSVVAMLGSVFVGRKLGNWLTTFDRP